MGRPAGWRVIVRFSEIALKKGNRRWFMQRLRHNVEHALKGLPVWDVRIRPNRCFVRVGDINAWAEIRERLRTVPGIKTFSLALEIPTDIEAMKQAFSLLAPKELPQTFRVRAKRGDKRFPMKSPEVESVLGQWIRETTGMKVDLREAELTFGIEVQKEGTFAFVNQEEGVAGLPVGTAGRVAVLLSGGIDSPVAAYRMLRRGCQVELVHFTSFPFTDRSSWDKCRALAEILTRYQFQTRLHIVPLGEAQQRIVVATPPRYRVLMYRRLMLRIAEEIATRQRCQALVTGESIGQVGSQTLSNITSVEKAVEMTVLRPLIGMDKQEITEEATRIGTYHVSIEPDMDCCQYLVPKRVATESTPEELAEVERAFDVEELKRVALEATQVEEFRWPRPPASGARSPQTVAVSLAIFGPDDRNRVLVVRRPAEPGEEFGGMWGLPATTVAAQETPEEAAVRLARQKLGIEVELGPVLARGTQERLGGPLTMLLFEARPSRWPPQLSRPVDTGGVTYYTDWKWGGAADLAPTAKAGSLCCRLFLEGVEALGR
jgi:thiamine biosynthesis protein ThiI